MRNEGETEIKVYGNKKKQKIAVDLLCSAPLTVERAWPPSFLMSECVPAVIRTTGISPWNQGTVRHYSLLLI